MTGPAERAFEGEVKTMTTRPVRGVEIAEVDEAAVASYLSATPEFFDRHAQLLAKIRLPDTRGGASTVSLLERQVEVLRERNRQLERKVKDFVDVARENDALGTRVLAHGAPPDRRERSRRRRRGDRIGAARGFRRRPVGARADRRRARRRASPESRFLRVVAGGGAGAALFRDAVQRRQAALRPAARFAARVPVRRAMPARSARSRSCRSAARAASACSPAARTTASASTRR